MKKILDAITTTANLKDLTSEQLVTLSKEIREQMINRLADTGGHVGSNLGMIEPTIALHYIFNSPTDKIIFDVSHQCYTHKLLTGRKEAYTNPNQYHTVTGFTNPIESEHDIFALGHTSTAISLACGLAKARDLKKEKSNIIAVIGDGALSGGEALEGLNNAATFNSNLIIVINDNEMSIAENHGGLYQNLKLLKDTKGEAKCNLFKALGFDYYFIEDGNHLLDVIEVFKKIKDIDHPTIVHLCTTKGKGYLFAEKDKETWHYMAPFDANTGTLLHNNGNTDTYENLTRDYLIHKMKADPTIVAVTAGTPKIFGFDEHLRKQYKNQFIDVGIAEEHAVAFISGIAKNGGKPIFGVSSSFLQRTYDQLSHDLALNRSPAVILVFFSGISQTNQTHMGTFDIPLTINIPNIIYLIPTCKEEYLDMLEWAIIQTDSPVIIRVPGININHREMPLLNNYSQPIKYEVACKGSGVAIIALGRFFELGKEVKDVLEQKTDISPTLINPRYITSIDEQTLKGLEQKHSVIITLEDGCIDGGFGEKIARFYGSSSVKVLNFGAKKEFIDNQKLEILYERYHLTVNQIVTDILKIL